MLAAFAVALVALAPAAGMPTAGVVPPPTRAAGPAVGARIGSIAIPAIRLRAIVREGTSAAVLARGPGHYPSTSLPGRGGTVGVAGHRVTKTHPFRELNRVRAGDAVVVTTASRRLVYRVGAMRIVAPSEVWPLRRSRGETLVLTACHPPRTALRRLVVFAPIASSAPLRTAR